MKSTNQKRSGSKEPLHIRYILADVLKSIEEKKMTNILAIIPQHIAETLAKRTATSQETKQQQAKKRGATKQQQAEKQACNRQKTKCNKQKTGSNS